MVVAVAAWAAVHAVMGPVHGAAADTAVARPGSGAEHAGPTADAGPDPTDDPGGGPPWTAPVGGPIRVERPFDPPPEPWSRGHRGVDLTAADGARIRAAGAGTVVFAGDVAGTPALSIDHGALRTTYLPVAASVAEGDRVGTGETIGALAEGRGHCPPSACLHCACLHCACLHWGLRRGADYLDPMVLIGRGGIRLLPMDGP